MDVFNLIAGAASILGLGFSAWAVVEVRALRARYHQQGRLPALVAALEGHASKLSDFLDAGGDLELARIEVAELGATLRSVEKVLQRPRPVVEVRRWFQNQGRIDSVEQVRSAYRMVRSLILELHQTIGNDQWL